MTGPGARESTTVDRLNMARLGATLGFAAAVTLAVVAVPHQTTSAQQSGRRAVSAGEMQRPIELFTEIDRPTTLKATLTPVNAFPYDGGAGADDRGTCPPVTNRTYSQANFDGGQFVLQAGFVEEEIAAVEFVVDPLEFPLTIRSTEMIFGQQDGVVTTTTKWTWLVWQGNPETGVLVAVFSSDDVILPHIVIPPPPAPQGVNVQVTVDPGDPDQIIIESNSTNSFTIGYRIDEHNDPPTTSCFGGLIPAHCCGPDPRRNAFPTTDAVNPPKERMYNWLFCRNCNSAFTCPPGWHRFLELGDFELSGDWNLRVTYDRADCPDEPFGACCFPDGTCSNDFHANCTDDGGAFQGDGTDCNVEGCPDPVGACCFHDANDPPGPEDPTCVMETEAECATRHDPDSDRYSVWSGPGVQCNATSCPDAIGACCFSSGSCVNLSYFNCEIADGVFRGIDTDCATVICNPFGACCMPDGSCTDEFETDCAAMGGAFQGHDNLCASVSCPQPVGACCLSNGGCISEIESNCLGIPGATWAGIGTDCADADGNGTADDCETNPAVGACCLESGSCILESETNCMGVPGATYLGDGTTCDDCNACLADIADSSGPGSDGVVNVFDLILLLSNWNTNGPGADIAPPDDVIDVFDLVQLLTYWSPAECP